MLENIVTQVNQLSPQYRRRLAQRIIQTLISPVPPPRPQPNRFGEFSGAEASMSTLEDFAIAEWRPTDEELDSP